MAMLASPSQLEQQATWASSDGELVESLLGQPLPSLRLACTTGGELDLAKLAIEPVVVFVHPGTETLRERRQDPDGLLGSGCTLQSRLFREHVASFAGRRFHVVGVSASSPEEQRRFSRRERLQFPLLSDSRMELASAIDLPTSCSSSGQRVYSRLTFIAHEGIIDRVFYPVPIPRRNALDVLGWLDTQGTVL
ncbi:MAG TPA: peroxiredoxin [Solirubrobacteraceae bacterium]|jgi:peroxiredoxin